MDLPADVRYYTATVEAIEHAAAMLDESAAVEVLRTDAAVAESTSDADDIVIGPGSLYRDEHASVREGVSNTCWSSTPATSSGSKTQPTPSRERRARL